MRHPGVEQLQTLRGMVDLLPEATPRWQWLEAVAREHFRRACVHEIRTPLLEATELFARGIGEATDVVGKEMYSFLDRGERSCTLRPEGTASVVRAAIQHGLLSQGTQKLWYGGPMFRYERPQGGRQRQFHQIGLEFLGFADPRSDVEAITIAWDLLQALGLENLQLELNSLGSRDDRQAYRNGLVAWLGERKDQLDTESQQRLSTNPLRILDSKNAQTQELLIEAPNLEQALSPASRERYEQVKAGLSALGIPFICNPRLVRGLDYYGHTAFEITSSALGAQATVCGGGRYDGLVEQLGGAATACVGWAMGLERLMLLLGDETNSSTSPDVVVISQGEAAKALAVPVARQLRQLNQAVEVDLSGAGFGKQLKRAGKSGARWAVLIGDAEAASGELQLKDLSSGDTRSISMELLAKEWLPD